MKSKPPLSQIFPAIFFQSLKDIKVAGDKTYTVRMVGQQLPLEGVKFCRRGSTRQVIVMQKKDIFLG